MSNNGYFGEKNDQQLDFVRSKYNDENELIEANEPDDFDAFNEETFAGDGIEDTGEDWEAEHDKLMALDRDKECDSAAPSAKCLVKFEDFSQEDSINFSLNDSNRSQFSLNSYNNSINPNSFIDSLVKNDLTSNIDSSLFQKMQFLQQQQSSTLNQQIQKQKYHGQMTSPQINHQFNKSLNQQSLNDIQLKINHQLQFQQQLQNQMNQLKLQQQSSLSNNLIKQQQLQLMQQIQFQQQVNANSLLNLINSRNNILQQQQQQFSNQMNRKTPINLDNLGNIQNQSLSNTEKENYIQSKLAEMQLSDKNLASNNQNSQQKYGQQSQLNPFQMISLLQQKQQQHSPKSFEIKPQITKNLPNAKTLEEIENELLNQSQSSRSNPNKESNENFNNQAILYQSQQQQSDLIKMAPYLNLNQYQTQQNQSDLQNLKQIQQKQLLQAWLLQQNSQQQTSLLQQQMLSGHNQALTNNLNNLLPSNFNFMNPQQKQQVISALAQRLASSTSFNTHSRNTSTSNNSNKEEIKYAL